MEFCCSRAWEHIQGELAAIAERFREVAESPPSIGYEPLLVESGYNRIIARCLARIVVRRGRRVGFEERQRTRVLQAIRFLAKPGRKRSAVLIRAKTLTAAWNETSIIETIFDEHRLPNEREFVELLQRAASGLTFDCDRLTGIAISVAEVARTRRGPRITAVSAAHEMFVSEFPRVDGPTAYTWNEYKRQFTDKVTEATRLEFGGREFDPRTAYFRMKARRSTDGNRGGGAR